MFKAKQTLKRLHYIKKPDWIFLKVNQVKNNSFKALLVLIILTFAGLIFIPGCQKVLPSPIDNVVPIPVTSHLPCYPPNPTGLFADSITNNSAKLHVNLHFTLQGKQVFVGFRYKAVNSATWMSSGQEDPVWIYNLAPGTKYEYYAISKCSDQNGTGYSKSLVHGYFTTLQVNPPGYCNCLVRPIPPGCAAACGF